MKRSTLPAGEIDKKNEEGAFKREENVLRRTSEQIHIGHEGDAVVQNNIFSNFEIQRNDEESGIQGNVLKSSVTCSAENGPQKQRMTKIIQAGLYRHV